MPSKQQWEKEIASKLVGRTITSVNYMSDKDVADMGWYSAGLIIHFDDGNEMLLVSDDEGNNAGAAFTSFEGLDTIPVI